jgi:eukaryotic-like serine/threonine-protein kinase
MSDIAPRLAAALADRYRIERPLGQGGMATVYLAEDLKHDRKVAIKVLKPELAAVLGGERFLSEIKTTARLQHPHILPLLDSGVADSQLFYVMPLVTGETLRARLDRERQLPIDDALLIAREVADALGHAHGQGIIHRDIKPENILLQDGHALVADFGIALAVQSAGGERMTQTGMSLGTPQYMSPEQAMGERVIDARSDIYALGAITYEMLVGEAPFTGPSVQAIIARVMSEEPRAIGVQRKAVPAEVEDAVMRALEKLPADRFASAREFAAALTASTSGTRQRTAARALPARGNTAAMAFGATSMALAALAAWGWMRPAAPAPDVVRYRVSVDSIVDTRDWTGSLAISPDGRTIVHTSSLDGPLLRRDRDALGFTPIPGTEGAQGPAFSPDGRRVAFFSAGRILTVGLDGGLVEVVDPESKHPTALVWGEDGYLYGQNAAANTGLLRIRAQSGAKWEPFTTLDSASGQNSHLLPDDLPDGQGFVFQVGNEDGSATIAVSDARGENIEMLFPGARARYVSGGFLVYSTSDGRLWSIPFDARARKATGTATQIATGIPGTMVGAVSFDVSRSGTLVYAQEDTRAQRELVWVSRDGTRTPFDSTWHGGFVSPRLSPDGQTLAVGMQDRTSAHIWLKPTTGGAPRRLTLGSAQHDEPAWSPDGRSVSFISGGTSSTVGAVYRRTLGGGTTNELVIKMDRTASEQIWSPVGGWLLLRTTTPMRGAGDVLRYRPGVDAAPIPVLDSPRSEYTPSVSPDGRWLAYGSNESGRLEVYVVSFPTPDGRKWQISTDGGVASAWSPRGDELFFLDLRGNMNAVAVQTGAEFSAGETRVLFPAGDLATRAVSRRNYDVSGDAKRFLMVQRAGGSYSAQLVVVEHFATELTKQTTGNPP